MVNKLRQHGPEVISARNTAMLEAVADLPPIVISDLSGVSASSALDGLGSPRTAGRTTSLPARTTMMAVPDPVRRFVKLMAG
ncbi:hypothetical protein ACGH52_39260 [Streptomyces sp. BBFR25]|uniref:hypothetical protein n=1 Tax=Streptomyces sp. BBFR25 TaxID=3372855 RepID=UPI0037DC07B2